VHDGTKSLADLLLPARQLLDIHIDARMPHPHVHKR